MVLYLYLNKNYFMKTNTYFILNTYKEIIGKEYSYEDAVNFYYSYYGHWPLDNSRIIKHN